MNDFQENTSNSCGSCYWFKESCIVPGKVCVHRKINGTDQTVGDVLWRILRPEDIIKIKRKE